MQLMSVCVSVTKSRQRSYHFFFFARLLCLVLTACGEKKAQRSKDPFCCVKVRSSSSSSSSSSTSLWAEGTLVTVSSAYSTTKRTGAGFLGHEEFQKGPKMSTTQPLDSPFGGDNKSAWQREADRVATEEVNLCTV